jgi:hypothetical protein
MQRSNSDKPWQQRYLQRQWQQQWKWSRQQQQQHARRPVLLVLLVALCNRGCNACERTLSCTCIASSVAECHQQHRQHCSQVSRLCEVAAVLHPCMHCIPAARMAAAGVLFATTRVVTKVLHLAYPKSAINSTLHKRVTTIQQHG